MSKRNKKKTSIIKELPRQPRKLNGSLESYASIDYPLFSFRYLQEISYNKSRDPLFFISFLTRLMKLSKLGWGGISASQRHGYGMEKLPRSVIKPALPEVVTPEVPLFVFRATGDNHPFIGFRVDKVFHILYIEAHFGDIYEHG